MPASVDAELFPNLETAIRFVEERGGGVVRTELAGTLFGDAMKLPPNVKLEKPHAEQTGSPVSIVGWL